MTRLAAVASQVLLIAALSGCVATPAPTTPSAAPSGPATSATPGSAAPTRTITKIEVLGVIGDSISLAVNACTQPGPCPEESWSGGDSPEVSSIASRLAKATGARPETVMAAKDGGDIADAAARIGQLAGREPDLVTILVGANDACAPNANEMTTVEDFRSKFSEVLVTLKSEAPDALALALSVPDLNQIWTLGRDNPKAAQLWSKFWGCRNLLRNPTSTAPQVEASRQAVADRVKEFNAVIAEECAASGNCISDNGALNEHRFTTAEVSSIDFFHPSSEGQRAIAGIAWTALTSQVELP